ncbi:MAG: TraB/GumN family protein [Saprospiraceae bacterium]|nr:TraB/GumN family protein [Lewinellaceae bacterium]
MLRTLFPLMTMLIAHTLFAQEPDEKLKGLLWEVSGNGITQKGFLYGTMHVPEKLAFNLSDSFFIALRQVEMVALETDHDQWQEFTEMLEGRERELFNPGGYGGYGYRRASAQPNLYNSQFQFSPPNNELLGAMLSAKPRMTNEFLYRSNQYRQDYEEDTYLDLFIFQAGRKLGKNVIGLETLEGSYEALVRAQFPDDEEENSDRRYYSGQYSRQTLEDAYRDQDLSLMDSLNKMAQPGKNFQRWMLDERNLVMVNRIDSILQSGTSLFSAVGAAHLPGESGLILQLRERGYTVRPVQFTSEHFKREKEAIEALRYPVELNRQWAADSTWSVDAPGKFYQTVDGMGLEQQLCADMSNGAYYAVYRVHTYGMWNGQSPEYVAERIDSLIYEKIPGKIQERKRFNNPFPGHEITTRTRRGDIIRYKIFATPMEVLVFAAGGNQNYAAGPEGTRFINSIQVYGQQPAGSGQPTTIQPPYGGFTVKLPGTPVVNTTLDKKADRYLLAAPSTADSAFCMLYRASYHDWDYIEEDTFELNIIGENIAEQFTKARPEVTLVASTPYPTQDVSFRSDRDSAWYYLRLIVDGPHYYLLACRKPAPGAPLAFFNSFSIQPTAYPSGWEQLRDSSLLFEAAVPKAALKPPAPFVEKLQRIIQEGFKKSNRNGGSYYEAALQHQYRLLKAPLQDEAISVTSQYLQGSSLANTLDSFQLSIANRVTDRDKMAIREKSWEFLNDSLLVGDFLIEDTNSTRGIRAKVLLTPGRLYTISATVQLDQPGSVFVDRFFDSFTPTDTTKGQLPFGKRDLAFLQEIYSPDSLTREKALERLGNPWFNSLKDQDFQSFRTAIDHPEFGKLKYWSRKRLLQSLNNFNSENALAYVLELCNRYSDSLRYRQTLLTVLAQMQTRPAQKALLKLLGQDNLYVTGGTISAIFEGLADTLELAARDLPQILKLAELDEYHEPVVNLLAEAVARDLAKPKIYRRMRAGLLKDAYRGLGRQQYQEEIKQDRQDNDRYMADDYEPGYGYANPDMGNDSDLERQLQLLAPFMRKDKEVRALFNAAARSPDKETQVTAMSLMLQQQLPVRTKKLQAFAADDRTRYTLYRHLAAVNQLDPYISMFTDTVALVRSILFEELDQRSEYEESRGIDSVRFVSQHRTVRYNNSPALVFFFDVKMKKEQDWQLAYVNVHLAAERFGYSEKTTGRDYDENYWKRPQVRLLAHLPESEKAEYIRKAVGEVRFANRERYRGWGGGGGDYLFEE